MLPYAEKAYQAGAKQKFRGSKKNAKSGNEQSEPRHQTNIAQRLISGIPAQIANISTQKNYYQRPRSLPL